MVSGIVVPYTPAGLPPFEEIIGHVDLCAQILVARRKSRVNRGAAAGKMLDQPPGLKKSGFFDVAVGTA